MQLTLQQAIEIMRKNKLKLTHQRDTLLRYLIHHQAQYVNTTQIDKYMRQQFPNMSHNTAYKNIRKLKDIGIIEERFTEGQQQIKYQCDFANHIHSHLICQNCGKVIELKINFTRVIQHQLQGYQVNNQRIEIYGICPECQRKLDH